MYLIPAVYTNWYIFMFLVFSHQADHVQNRIKRRWDIMVRPVNIMKLIDTTSLLREIEGEMCK